MGRGEQFRSEESEGATMTRNQFSAMCSKYNIDPAVALENENLVQALQDKNDKEVERILQEEF